MNTDNDNNDNKMHFEQHVFFCSNVRENGKSACGDHNALAMKDYTKQKCKNMGMDNTRINQAGCLGRCEHGPVIVVYPQGTWYTYVDKQDIDEIIDKHLVNGDHASSSEDITIVDRLLIAE
jgi:(2Fe-2S) ferredoxin